MSTLDNLDNFDDKGFEEECEERLHAHKGYYEGREGGLFIDEIEKILDSKTVEKAYDDALSKPAKQIGLLLEDVFKTVRLLSLPLRLTSAIQDKLDNTIERVSNKVPLERQIRPPLQIIGPIYENIKYLDDNSILYELFEELLARSIDSERIEEAHPSFIYIIAQLSHDEAIILFQLKYCDFDVVDTLDLDPDKNRFMNLKIENATIPKDLLLFPTKFNMYCSHLESLNLVSWPVIDQEPIMDGDRQIGVRRYSKIHLTEFGRFFVNACVPEKGFRNR